MPQLRETPWHEADRIAVRQMVERLGGIKEAAEYVGVARVTLTMLLTAHYVCESTAAKVARAMDAMKERAND